MRWLVRTALVLVLWSLCWAREGMPVLLTWDYATTMPSTDVVTHFQLQRCTTGACAGVWTFCATENGTCTFSGTKLVRYGADTTFVQQTATTSIPCTNAQFGDPLVGTVKHCDTQDVVGTCTPVDIGGATIAVGQSWGTAVATGTWAANNTLKTASFTAQTARYVKLVALSEVHASDITYTTAAEIGVTNNSVAIPNTQMAVVSADSQEFQGNAGAAQHVLDGDPATFWHTAWFTSSVPLPHTIILDLGQTYTQVNSLTYLPRPADINGAIADYAVYLSTTLTSSYTDALVEGGQSYIYQVVAVGTENQANARSAASTQVCPYVKALHRGRPDVVVP